MGLWNDLKRGVRLGAIAFFVAGFALGVLAGGGVNALPALAAIAIVFGLHTRAHHREINQVAELVDLVRYDVMGYKAQRGFDDDPLPRRSLRETIAKVRR